MKYINCKRYPLPPPINPASWRIDGLLHSVKLSKTSPIVTLLRFRLSTLPSSFYFPWLSRSPYQRMAEVLYLPSNSGSSPSCPSMDSANVADCDAEELGRGEGRRDGDQLSFLALLLTIFRKSLACRSDRRQFCAMEIGWPNEVRHVAHVTFDRFNGFLGLPVEFEPEVPRRAPSARYTSNWIQWA